MDGKGHAKNIDKNGVPRKKATFLKRIFSKHDIFYSVACIEIIIISFVSFSTSSSLDSFSLLSCPYSGLLS